MIRREAWYRRLNTYHRRSKQGQGTSRPHPAPSAFDGDDMSELAEDCICPAEHATCPYHESEALCENFPVNSHQHDDYRAISWLREQRKIQLELMRAGSCSSKANGQTCEVGNTPGPEQTFQVNRTPELDHPLTTNKEKPTREPRATNHAELPRWHCDATQNIPSYSAMTQSVRSTMADSFLANVSYGRAHGSDMNEHSCSSF
jgi:hypothetical protein